MNARGGSRILLTLGFVAAALAYSGWTASHTVLDPGATPKLARALFDTKAVQDHLQDQLTTQVDRELRIRGADPRVTEAVEKAVRDPRVVAAFADAVHAMHAALLGDAKPNDKITIDPRVLTASVRDALATTAPGLAAKLAKSQPMDVQFDAANLPNLGHARDAARTATLLGLLAALALIAGSLLLAHDRRAISHLGRRIAYLAICPLLLFILLPRIAPSLLGENGDVLRAALGVYAPHIVPSAIVFVVLGIAVMIGARFMSRPTNASEAPAVPQVPHAPPAQPAADEPRIKERLYL